MSGSRMHLRAAGLAALALLAGAPAAHAQLAVEHDSTVVTEQTGNGNGVAEPGETLNVVENVTSAEFSLLTGVTGHLTTTATGATVSTADAPWPDLDFGLPAGNLTPFGVGLDAAAECGARVPFDLALSTSGGPVNVSFSIPTGSAGAFKAYDAVDVPVAIPDPGTADAPLAVADSGRVKGLRVRIGSLLHSYDGDLRISIVAPDGRSVILAQQRGGSGSDFSNTVFDDAATTSIRNAAAPFTGSFQPDQPLSNLDGAPLAGTWTLRVSDLSPGNAGGIISWGVDAAPAVCAPAVTPPPPTTTPVNPNRSPKSHGNPAPPGLVKKAKK